MQIWNSGKENLLDDYAHKNLEVDYTHFEKPLIGIKSYKDMLRKTHDYFPDLKIILHEVISSENNKVTVTWTYKGTHSKGNLFGVEPKGKEVEVRGITVLEIQNTLVIKESGIVDNFNLIMQLGLFEE